MSNVDRAYWVVSPNVKNDNSTVGAWRQASLTKSAAFMGYSPDDHKHAEIGPKFAGRVQGGIEPGDVILIARRRGGEPEVVGFGVVDGRMRTELPDFDAPDDFGSLRLLNPFVPWTKPRSGVPLIEAVKHTMALARLHPKINEAHRQICEWMDRHLQRRSTVVNGPADQRADPESGHRSTPTGDVESRDISVVASTHNNQLDYLIQTRTAVVRAQKLEALLLENYQKWLKDQERTLRPVRMGALQCDGYEKETKNLIEAKSSTSRENIRMAVGQLLDYAFQAKEKLGDSNLAVLLPEKPREDVEKWLDSVGIKLIWQVGATFLDNANGQFT